MLLREDSRIGTVRIPSFQAIVCVVDFTYDHLHGSPECVQIRACSANQKRPELWTLTNRTIPARKELTTQTCCTLRHNRKRIDPINLLLQLSIAIPTTNRVTPVIPVDRAHLCLQESPQEPVEVRQQSVLVHRLPQLLHLLVAGLLSEARAQVRADETSLLLHGRIQAIAQNVRVGEVVVRHPLAEVVGNVHAHGDLARVLEVHEHDISVLVHKNVAVLEVVMTEHHFVVLRHEPRLQVIDLGLDQIQAHVLENVIGTCR